MPVAGVGEHDLAVVGDAGRGSSRRAAASIGSRWPKSAPWCGSRRRSRSLLVDDGLRVVALHNPRRAFNSRESGSVVFTFPSGCRAAGRLRSGAQPPPGLVRAAAPGRPRIRRWPRTPPGAPPPGGALASFSRSAVSAGTGCGFAARWFSSRCAALANHARRPSRRPASGGSSSPARSP